MAQLEAITDVFQTTGRYLMAVLAFSAVLLVLTGISNIRRPGRAASRAGGYALILANVAFGIGFLWICWFHYQIYHYLPLDLPVDLIDWLNRRLVAMNRQAAYGFPLLDPARPPRYAIPVWIEKEKYYFWFMSYSLMALYAHYRLPHHRFRGVLQLLLAGQVALLCFFADPFRVPLPRFLSEIGPWFASGLSAADRVGLFMKLYPRMIFYYNASYMWLHPPLLFLAYGCITITFATSVFMMAGREASIEQLGYDFAKLGFFLLTLGMLLGYPWALQAWGPNWWWDPKICSSIMMWAIFSTFLHTRLYANRPFMWYFTSVLGILCFLAMVFTFITSFYFPGEHTFQ